MVIWYGLVQPVPLVGFSAGVCTTGQASCGLETEAFTECTW